MSAAVRTHTRWHTRCCCRVSTCVLSMWGNLGCETSGASLAVATPLDTRKHKANLHTFTMNLRYEFHRCFLWTYSLALLHTHRWEQAMCLYLCMCAMYVWICRWARAARYAYVSTHVCIYTSICIVIHVWLHACVIVSVFDVLLWVCLMYSRRIISLIYSLVQSGNTLSKFMCLDF